MAVTNLFEAILGREQIKWDAWWHLFEWLLEPSQGHGLDNHVLTKLNSYIFGRTLPKFEIKREFQVSKVRDGRGKWVDLAVAMPSLDEPTHIMVMDDVDRRSPGGKRKLENLIAYKALTRERYPFATIRVVVVTNANDITALEKTREHLGPEVDDYFASDGWRLLPLCLIGSWISSAQQPVPVDENANKMSLFLRDFAIWTASL